MSTGHWFLLLSENPSLSLCFKAVASLLFYYGLKFIRFQTRNFCAEHRLSSASNKLAILDQALGAISSTFLLLLSLFLFAKALPLSEKLEGLLNRSMGAMCIFQIGLIGHKLSTYILKIRIGADQRSKQTVFPLLNFVIRSILWIFISLLILDNLGIQITSLVAGLGVGGVAVALAVQNILGDLLGSMSIALDKPFEVGDSISVDNFTGTVEQIGIKTTRVKSVSGEEIIFPNGDLLKSRIRNMRRMREQRSFFTLGICHQTAPEKVQKALAIIRESVLRIPNTRIERNHFTVFSADALVLETIFWLSDSSSQSLPDVQQQLNLEILKHFQEEQIILAHPQVYLMPSSALNS